MRGNIGETGPKGDGIKDYGKIARKGKEKNANIGAVKRVSGL
jgi:hypothetical protein